ncbi:MAG: preprotein translocase subunit SecG [Rhodanobacteraceae bacterium]
MIYTILSVFNILIAAAMIVLILMQRGAGADAGASFGGGGSSTVFGARGSATFLSRATGVLAALFFVISLAMGIFLEHKSSQAPDQSLGVMAGAAQTDAAGAGSSPAPASAVPAAGKPAAQGSDASDVPQPEAANSGAGQNQAKPAISDTPAPQPAKTGSAG